MILKTPFLERFLSRKQQFLNDLEGAEIGHKCKYIDFHFQYQKYKVWFQVVV